ncbi:MAG: ABC transporter permease [Parachlamydiales bacterium]|jgi:ABC-type polysaccharide/polyol phosphate export permease
MLRNFFLVSEFEFRAIINDKPGLLRIFMEPFAYLFLLAAGLQSIVGIYQVDYISFVYPGIVGLQLLRLFLHSIYRLTIDRRWGLQAIKMIAGTTNLAYFLGMSVVPICLFIVQTSISYPLALLLGVQLSISGFFALLIVGILATFFWVSLAIVCTYYFKKYSQRDLFIQFLFLPISLSAPIFYSLDNVPEYLKVISHFNPLSYQVIALRELFLNLTISTNFYITLSLSIFSMWIALKFMKNAEYLPSEI